MTKKFSKLRSGMSPDAQAKSKEKAKAMLEEMPLHELRLARGLSQQTLADILHVKQPAVAKIEKRTDMYLSTLRNHIRAMGGELDLIARFPDGDVLIKNLVMSDADQQLSGIERILTKPPSNTTRQTDPS